MFGREEMRREEVRREEMQRDELFRLDPDLPAGKEQWGSFFAGWWASRAPNAPAW